MPQGGAGGSRKRARSATASVSSAPPESSTYARKPDAKAVKRGGPLNHTLNATFRAALPGMIRNIELIAAGKAVQSGLGLHTGDMQRAGAQEAHSTKLKRVQVARKAGDAVVARRKRAGAISGECSASSLVIGALSRLCRPLPPSSSTPLRARSCRSARPSTSWRQGRRSPRQWLCP